MGRGGCRRRLEKQHGSNHWLPDPIDVHVDPATGKANGPHRKKLRTYFGIIAQDKVFTFISWKQVPAAHKDLIWEDIQVFELNFECYCNWLY